MNRIYFCEPSESVRTGINTYFKESEDFIVSTFSDSATFAKKCGENPPDVVVVDLEFDNLREVFNAIDVYKPKTVLTSRKMGDEIENVLKNLSFDAVIYKPYSLNDVKNELISLTSRHSERIRIMGNKNVDERLSNIFIRAGIPPQIKGYQYLRYAVKLAITEPEMVNSITKKLYPTVAEYFNTTPSKVERAIRHAIEVAWSRGKIENINAIFGIKIYGKGDKPTNGELIALVADKMVIEMM